MVFAGGLGSSGSFSFYLFIWVGVSSKRVLGTKIHRQQLTPLTHLLLFHALSASKSVDLRRGPAGSARRRLGLESHHPPRRSPP